MFGGCLEVFAGPPFVTDDPETVAYQHGEVYLASQHIETADGWAGTAPHVEVNYGVVPNVQLHLIAPLVYNAPTAGSAHYGYGDTELGVKFRFVQESEYLPQVGVFPLLEVPTGNEGVGLGAGHVLAFFPLWIQKSWGKEDSKWTMYGGGGYGINSGVGNENNQTPLTLKYIDPSYMIRSVPASPQDRIYCMRLGQAAVHAGMAGKTGLVVARWHMVYVHVPIAVVTSARRTVDPGKDIWLSVLESTGQPARYC